jgi:hypothetical protein
MREGWRYVPDIRHWVLGDWSPEGVPVRQYASVPAGSLAAVAVRGRRHVAEAMLRESGIEPPAVVFDGAPGEQASLTCGACWAVSFAAEAVASRVCPSCGHAEAEDAAVVAAAAVPPAEAS